MKVEVIQHNPVMGDFQGNIDKILRLHQSDADIIVLPELAVSGYYPGDLLTNPDFVYKLIHYQNELVKSLKGDGILIFGGIKCEGGHVQNGAYVCIDEDCHFVPKLSLPTYGPFDEKRHFTVIEPYYGVFKVDDMTFAVGVCEDMWTMPEEIFNRTAVSMYIFVNASPFETGKFSRRLDFARVWASKGSYVVYANLVGGQDGIIFDGASFVLDPSGNVQMLLKAFEEDSEVFSPYLPVVKVKPYDGLSYIPPIEIDIDVSNDFVADAKIEEYPSYPEDMYKAIVLGIRDYVKKSGFQKVIVSVSGGIDSAVGLVLAADAVGKDNVIALTMPSHITSSETLNDAHKLAKNLGVKIYEIPIKDIYTVMRDVILSSTDVSDNFDVADENLQSRIRGMITMYLSNKLGALALSMGNKSEIAVGYNTLYGDTAGAYSPLGDAYKTDVYALAEYINREKEIIPRSIIERKPSAELREGQYDEESLPPYTRLDEFLKDYIDRRMPITYLIDTYGRDFTLELVKKIERVEYKRKQLPPAPKLQKMSFYTDRRYPIMKKSWWD